VNQNVYYHPLQNLQYRYPHIKDKPENLRQSGMQTPEHKPQPQEGK
jgi:hypothetical protein